MCFAIPDKEVLREALSWADVAHFLMPFWLCIEGVKLAEEMGVPHTAAFHVQPENITYTLGLGRNAGINDWLYRLFYRLFYRHFTHIHCPSRFIAGELALHGLYRPAPCDIQRGGPVAFPITWKEKPEGYPGSLFSHPDDWAPVQ